MPKYGLCMLSPTELSRRRIKPFSYPGQAFFIAACLQQLEQAQLSAAKFSAIYVRGPLDLPYTFYRMDEEARVELDETVQMAALLWVKNSSFLCY